MAFGTELQGKMSHEALLGLQDFELRLLENMKKCITHRIKIDRDYANSLSALASMAAKLDCSEFNVPVGQVWQNISKEMESISKLIQENANKMCVNTMEKLLQLICEKKTVRRLYADERNRLESESIRLHEETNRLESEYEKSLIKLQQNRSKYEENMRKAKAGQKQEEIKSKYVKSECKVHNVHNDYIIALKESNLYETHNTSIMLPSLLSFQQSIQESLVQQCKEILVEYASLTDCTSENFCSVQEKIRNSVNAIDPRCEYKEFVAKHRSEPLKCSMQEFQNHNCNNTALVANEIALDSLTIDSLKQKRKSYNDQLDTCRLRISNKKQELSDVEAQLSKESDNVNNLSLLVHRRTAENLKREILELQCVEEKQVSLSKLIINSLDQLGDADLPSGLIDSCDSNNQDSDSNPSPVNTPSNTVSNITQKLTNIATMLRVKPNKKSHPSIVIPTPPTRDFINDNSFEDDATPQIPTTDKNEFSPDIASGNDTTVSNGDKLSDGYQQQRFSDPNASKSLDFVTSQMVLHPECSLEEEEWYHGVLPREEVQRLLVVDGDYLVRASKNKRTGETQYVLSVMWATHKHFIIQEAEDGYRFEGEVFPTVQELILNQHHSGVPVTRKSEAILRNAILRPDWELRNDDIELNQKIGSGQFGEVFRGIFKTSGMEVAIKTCRETLSDDVKKKFLQEGRILKQYDHPNIVKFIGIAAQRHPVMIVMEYIPGGALLAYLRKHGAKQPLNTIIQMCEDAAAGMAYLESKNCLHRDLAARNCLVGVNNVVKISDFGMSREEQEYVVSGGLKQIPIKWTAPEALNFGTYTSACDVWSFGILVWEVFSFGGTPYPGLTNSQAREKVDEGYRMPPPENTPDEINQMMLRCWEQDPKSRPRFSELYRLLQQIRTNSSNA